MTLIDKAEALALFAADENVPTQLVRDAIAALPARGVKPLVWTAREDGLQFYAKQHASGSIYFYYTVLFSEYTGEWSVLLDGLWRDGFPDAEAAKAAAQADYEARILAALDMTNVQKMHIAAPAPTDAAYLNGPAEAVTMPSTTQPCTWPTCGCTAKGQFCEAPVRWFPQPALAPTDAAHVNETPKSEHDAGNVLTDADLIARLREIQGQAGLFASAAADRIETLVKYRDAYAEMERIATEALRKAEARAERLEAALVEHNDLLRSALAIAKREGVEGQIASTNWDAYYNRVAVVLKRHHQTANEARATITEATDDPR